MRIATVPAAPTASVNKKKVKDDPPAEGSVESPGCIPPTEIEPTDVPWSDVVKRRSRAKPKPKAPTAPQINVPSSKNNKKVVFGRASTSIELVKIRKRALFVSRFSASVSCDSVKELLSGLQLSSLEVKQLKTKHPSYSSFYISVNESDLPAVNSPDVWPVGVLISPFYGSPKGRLLKPSNPTEDGTSVNHNG